MRAEGLEPSTQGLKVVGGASKSQGRKSSVHDSALKAITISRQEVQKLLDATPWDEHYVLSILGPILVNLKDAQASLEGLR
jgi:hypothetical protein